MTERIRLRLGLFLWDNFWKHSESWGGTAGHEKLDETRNSRACGWMSGILFQKPLSAFQKVKR
jgi:hypothetical protein